MAVPQTRKDVMPLVLLPEESIPQGATQRMLLRKMGRKTRTGLALERRLWKRMLPGAVR
jgi:hypothetical protein